MRTRRRPSVPGIVAGALLLMVAGGCDVSVAGPLQEAGNVEVRMGAAVTESDTAVLVAGEAVIRYPSQRAALWLDRFERYSWGGFPELGHGEAERHHLSWRVLFHHADDVEERGDSLIYRYFDHGGLALADSALDKRVDAPAVGPDATVRFESFVAYQVVSYTRAEWENGESMVLTRASFHEDLERGLALALASTGSDQVEPVQATVASRPFSTLAGLETGFFAVDLAGSMPVFGADQPMVLAFDRPLDPARAYIALVPFPGQPGAGRAFVQPRAATSRVVIPPHVLRNVLGDAGDRAAFRAVIVEFMVEAAVVSGQLRAGPAPFALPFVQRGETVVLFRLEG